MALDDYSGALRQGRRRYQEAVAKGQYPYLPVLDDILANTDIVSEVNLGVIDIPLERVVGTKTQGRTQAFASSFLCISVRSVRESTTRFLLMSL